MPVCWEPSYWIHIQSRYLYILQYYYCRNFLLTENYYSTVYPMTVNLHKGPSPTVRKAKLCLWRKYILRAEGGISCALPWKCSPLTQIRREQKNAWSSSTCLLYGTDPHQNVTDPQHGGAGVLCAQQSPIGGQREHLKIRSKKGRPVLFPLFWFNLPCQR